jgi:DUF1680 family protein
MRSSTRTARDTMVHPGPQAMAALAPLAGADVRLVEGFWARRAQVNRDASMASAVKHLESWGALPYLRAAASGTGVPDVPVHNDPLVYKILDSDIYKWLEAVAYESARVPLDAAVARAADDVIELIVAAQRQNGYVHSWTIVNQPAEQFVGWKDGTELYCAGHLIQAAVAWHRAAGDDRLLRVAIRLADLLDDPVGGPAQLLSAHPGLEMAFVELYRTTGHERYLASAAAQLERRGHGALGAWWYSPDHFLDHRPVRQSRTIHGHAVMSLFLLCGVVDVAVETHDSELLAVAEDQWQDMVDRKLYITGGVGSRHHDEAFGEPFELPPDTAYSETCAAVASIMLSWRLLLATGDVKYSELIERTLYNGVLPGVSQDGLSYLYVNPLQVRTAGRILTPDGYDHRQEWFQCACCPPNLMRVISAVGQLAVTTSDGSVDLHQLLSADITAGDRELSVRSDLPFGEGRVTVTVTEPGADEWTLRIRRPQWAHAPGIEASWDHAAVADDVDGYLVIRRQWAAGDEVSLTFGMDVTAYAADPRVDAYRGQAALMRGPLVYCFEETDLPAQVDLDRIRLVTSLDSVTPRRVEGLTDVVALDVPMTVEQSAGGALYAPVGSRLAPSAENTVATAIPYLAWGNRDAPRMRVWTPVADD